MMRKLFLLFVLSFVFVLQLFAEHNIEANFSKPKVIQNYPVNNQLNMDGAMLSYEAINSLIDSASKSIDIEVFYINNEKKESKLDKHIIQPLVNKANTGVKVRIIVDDRMANTYPNDVKYLNSIPNIEVRRTKFFNAHGVFHVKMILVDDETFYLGSHNFDWVTFELNHELGVIFKDDSSSKSLSKVFEHDWKNTEDSASQESKLVEVKPSNNAVYAITVSPADIDGVPSDKTQFIRLINKAKKSIEMQAMIIDAYDIYNKNKEWAEFSKALQNAAERGVKLKLMFSDWEFTKGETAAANKFLQELLACKGKDNIEIKYSSFPQAVPCVPYSEVDHAKYAIFDNQTVWISTANITEGYFDSSRDISFLSRKNDELADQLGKIFSTMWTSKYMTAYKDPVTKITDNLCSPQPSAFDIDKNSPSASVQQYIIQKTKLKDIQDTANARNKQALEELGGNNSTM